VNLTWLDWSVVLAVAIFFIAMAYRTNRYTRSTADFLAASRVAGRYMLTMAEGMVGLAAVGTIAAWQVSYRVGFAANWWAQLGMPLSLIMMLVGWVIYRYRETRVLTLAQLFEIRYGKRFRIVAGIICFTSGLLNYGIFPAAAANFFVYYCGLPDHFTVLGVSISTYAFLVILLVVIAVYFAFIGGQISIMVTDFMQGMFSNYVMLAILVLLLIKFPLSDVFEGLLIAEPGKSLVNPFDAQQVKGFNPTYFLIGLFGSFVNRLAWQGSQGYNCAAKSPHEAKMAGVLGGFRGWAFMYGITLIPLVAYMIMHHPAYADTAAVVSEKLSQIENEQVRDQMITPMTMTTYMPVGMMGAFAAVMFAAFVSTNDTYLHSWGSIFVQDVIMPLLKKPLSTKQHLLLLRLAIAGVGAFGICWSIFVPQIMDIWMFFALTGAIWLGGAGVVIIGALYTRWGTTAGAYAALISGSILAVGGLILKHLEVPWVVNNPYLTGQWIWFWAMMVAIGLYLAASLLGKRQRFNLEKMLHRGRYRVRGDHDTAQAPAKTKWSWKTALGITDEFSLGDKIIYGIAIGKSMVLFVLFVIMTTLAVVVGLSDRQWSYYHRIMLAFWIFTSFAVAVWLTIGGVRDGIALFRDLKNVTRDYTDDGRVLDHDYEQTTEAAPQVPPPQETTASRTE